MTGRSAADALLSGGNVEVIRAPQCKPAESRSIARWPIAQVRLTALISSALATEWLGSKVELVRFSRLQI